MTENLSAAKTKAKERAEEYVSEFNMGQTRAINEASMDVAREYNINWERLADHIDTPNTATTDSSTLPHQYA